MLGLFGDHSLLGSRESGPERGIGVGLDPEGGLCNPWRFSDRLDEHAPEQPGVTMKQRPSMSAAAREPQGLMAGEVVRMRLCARAVCCLLNGILEAR